jgi:hypothetical protein
MNIAQQPNYLPAPRAQTRKPQRFLVGRSSAGQWVARDEQGRCGGLFASHADALHFARREMASTPCAIALVTEPLELFLKPESGSVANDNPRNDAVARAPLGLRT